MAIPVSCDGKRDDLDLGLGGGECIFDEGTEAPSLDSVRCAGSWKSCRWASGKSGDAGEVGNLDSWDALSVDKLALWALMSESALNNVSVALLGKAKCGGKPEVWVGSLGEMILESVSNISSKHSFAHMACRQDTHAFHRIARSSGLESSG